MKVTPLDIRKKSFDKVTFGGYDKEDVNAFLQALSVAWENMNAKNEELERKLTEANSELLKLREMEVSLLNTLKQTQEANSQLIEQAKKEAQILVREGQSKANLIVEDAKMKAKSMLRDANQLAYQSISEMRDELKKLDYNYRLIEKQKEKLAEQMRSFVNETLVKIDTIESYHRTASYNEEIKKANAFMQQSNETVKTEIQELDKKFPTNHTEPHTETKNYIQSNPSSSLKPTPAANRDSETVSFFDSL